MFLKKGFLSNLYKTQVTWSRTLGKNENIVQKEKKQLYFIFFFPEKNFKKKCRTSTKNLCELEKFLHVKFMQNQVTQIPTCRINTTHNMISSVIMFKNMSIFSILSQRERSNNYQAATKKIGLWERTFWQVCQIYVCRTTYWKEDVSNKIDIMFFFGFWGKTFWHFEREILYRVAKTAFHVSRGSFSISKRTWAISLRNGKFRGRKINQLREWFSCRIILRRKIILHTAKW